MLNDRTLIDRAVSLYYSQTRYYSAISLLGLLSSLWIATHFVGWIMKSLFVRRANADCLSKLRGWTVARQTSSSQVPMQLFLYCIILCLTYIFALQSLLSFCLLSSISYCIHYPFPVFHLSFLSTFSLRAMFMFSFPHSILVFRSAPCSAMPILSTNYFGICSRAVSCTRDEKVGIG